MGDKFDIDYKLLPPELQIKLWVLSLDADTSKVNLVYRPGRFKTNVTYNYGGSIEAGLAIRRFDLKLGYDPGKQDADLGLVHRGFRFKASANTQGKSAGLSLGFGAALLPFPDELAQTFNSGALSLQNLAGTISTAPDNPLAWYRLHSDDIATLSKAAKLGQAIADKKQAQKRFGAALRLNYNAETGFLIHGGMLLRF